MIKQTEYSYNFFLKKKFNVGFRCVANFNNSDNTQAFPFNSNTYTSNSLYQYAGMHAHTGLIKLVHTKETDYSSGDNIFMETFYKYENLNNQFEVSAVYQSNSNGSVLKKYFKYPNDLKWVNENCMMMSERNILAPVIIQVDSIDNEFIQSVMTNYENFYGYTVSPSLLSIRRGTGAEEIEKQYLKYNNKGDLVHFKGKDNIDHIIFWRLKESFPIALFQNISYPNVINNTTLTSKLRELEKIEDITLENSEKVQNLNQLIRELLPLDAQIVTYTYKPLVGITSMTDIRGLTTFYYYDYFSRLLEVYTIENGQKKILQRNDYQYINN